MKSVNLAEGQTMDSAAICQPRAAAILSTARCAITQTIMGTNWRSYGLQQSRGGLPSGPVTVMVHMASVWVPFTSESKEAIASYPEIQKELRLALQAVGRKLGMYRAAAAESETGRRAAQDLPALPGRSGHGGQRNQRGRSPGTVRTAAEASPKSKRPTPT